MTLRVVRGLTRQFMFVVPPMGLLLVILGYSGLDLHYPKGVAAIRLIMFLSAVRQWQGRRGGG